MPSLFLHEVGVLPGHHAVGMWLSGQGVRHEWCTRATMLRGDRYQVTPETLVAGSVQFVHAALTLLGVAVPDPLGFPAALEPFYFRRISKMMASEARSLAGRGRLFVKPADELKAFNGMLSTEVGFADALLAYGERRVYVADPVEFTSEWRCFVVRGRCEAVAGYSPDGIQPHTGPSARELQPIVEAAFAASGLAGFSVDVGRLADGRLAVVEINDGYALGSYGIDPSVHYRLLWERWKQLTRLPNPRQRPRGT